jgi:hypothetical protein
VVGAVEAVDEPAHIGEALEEPLADLAEACTFTANGRSPDSGSFSEEAGACARSLIKPP